jgi:hypothetical protein
MIQMKKLPILITLCFWAIMGYSQNTYLHTYHPEPDLEFGYAGEILKCKNGDQIFTSIYDDTIGSQNKNILIVTRIDSTGNIVWNAALQEQYDNPAKIFEDLGGNLYFFINNYIYACVVKISATGQVIWSKHFSENSGFFDALMLKTGEFVAVGEVFNQIGLKKEGYIVKIDQNGEILWEKSTNFEEGGGALTIINTEDGGMIIGGIRDGNVKFPGGSLFIAKIDLYGKLEWVNSLGYFNSFIRKILKTGPSNYTIVSSGLASSSGANSHILLTNIDDSGKINWSKRLPNSNGGQYLVFDAIMKKDELILTGIYSKIGPYNIFLLNTSLTGNINWLSIFSPSLSVMFNIQANDYNGFLLSGVVEEVVNTSIYFPAVMKTDSLGQIPCLSEIDYNPPLQVVDYPVKVDSGGTLITLKNVAVLDTPIIRTDITFTKKVICESNATQNIQTKSFSLFRIYPNPASSEVTIELTPEYQVYGTKLQIEISDALGRRVYGIPISHYEKMVMPKGILSPGYYVVSVLVQGKVLQSQKLVVVE